jgi:ribosomal protein S4E
MGILNRKEISMRTGIPRYQIERFVKAITGLMDMMSYPKTDSRYRALERD